MALRDRVLGLPLREGIIGAQLEVSLEDRSDHQLQGRLQDTGTSSWDAEPTKLPTGLWDHPLPAPFRGEAAGV